MTRPPATISIDLDDLWSYRRSFGLDSDASASLLPLAVPRFVDFMAGLGLRGTAFVVGHDAAQPENAPLLRSIAQAGHELANHSDQHAADIDTWPAERQQVDLARAHAAIRAASGFSPRGFRGPSFRLSAQLLATIQAMGYRYDSSTFPSSLGALARHWQARRARAMGARPAFAHDAYGSSSSRKLPLHPYTWALAAGPLVEVPITTLPGLRLPLHGTYLQHLADHSTVAARLYAGAALALCRRAGVAPHYLLHATDFIGCDDPVECAFVPGMRRPWRDKRAMLARLFDLIRAGFEPMPIDDYVTRVAGAGTLPLIGPERLA